MLTKLINQFSDLDRDRILATNKNRFVELMSNQIKYLCLNTIHLLLEK